MLLPSATLDRVDLCEKSWAEACFAWREREGRSCSPDNSSVACSSISEPQEVKCPQLEKETHRLAVIISRRVICRYKNNNTWCNTPFFFISSLVVISLSHTDFPNFTKSPLGPLCSIRLVLDRGFPMLLCAVASDSTLVYQRMTDGLVTPDPPLGPFQDMGRRQHRKRRRQQQQSWGAGLMTPPTGVDGRSMRRLRQRLYVCCAQDSRRCSDCSSGTTAATAVALSEIILSVFHTLPSIYFHCRIKQQDWWRSRNWTTYHNTELRPKHKATAVSSHWEPEKTDHRKWLQSLLLLKVQVQILQ